MLISEKQVARHRRTSRALRRLKSRSWRERRSWRTCAAVATSGGCCFRKLSHCVVCVCVCCEKTKPTAFSGLPLKGKRLAQIAQVVVVLLPSPTATAPLPAEAAFQTTATRLAPPLSRVAGGSGARRKCANREGYLRVVNWPKLIAASSETSAKLSTIDRNTKTQRMRSKRVLRCHQGGLLQVCARVHLNAAAAEVGVLVSLFGGGGQRASHARAFIGRRSARKKEVRAMGAPIAQSRPVSGLSAQLAKPT